MYALEEMTLELAMLRKQRRQAAKEYNQKIKELERQSENMAAQTLLMQQAASTSGTKPSV